MTKTTVSTFDPTRYLQDEEDIALFLEAAAEEAAEAENNDILLQAINTAAKARGIMQVAKDAGVSRESLYKSLAPNAKPRFDTIAKVLHALGVQMTFAPLKSDTAEP